MKSDNYSIVSLCYEFFHKLEDSKYFIDTFDQFNRPSEYPYMIAYNEKVEQFIEDISDIMDSWSSDCDDQN